MNSSGQFHRNFGANGAFSAVVQWEISSQSQVDNQSMVKVWFVIRSNRKASWTEIESRRTKRLLTFNIDGKRVYRDGYIWHVEPGGKSVIRNKDGSNLYVEVPVTHNTNGRKSIHIGVNFDAKDTINGILPSRSIAVQDPSVVLKPITRISRISDVSGEGVLGEPMTLQISRWDSGIRHDIYFTGPDNRRIKLASDVGNTHTFTPSIQHAHHMWNSPTAKALIELVTKRNGRVLGKENKTVTLRAPSTKPKLGGYMFINVGGTGQNYIAGRSKLRVESRASTEVGSAVSSMSATVNGQRFHSRTSILNFTTSVLTTPGENTVEWTITDTRGNKSVIRKTIQVQGEARVSITLRDIKRTDRSGRLDRENGTYASMIMDVPASASVSETGIQYRAVGTTSWTTVSRRGGGERLTIPGFRTDTAYQIRGYAKDSLSGRTTHSAEYRLEKGRRTESGVELSGALLQFHESGDSLGVGAPATRKGELVVALSTRFAEPVNLGRGTAIHTGQMASGTFAMPASPEPVSVDIGFDRVFSKEPKVAMTPRADHGDWKIQKVSKDGFRTEQVKEDGGHTVFDWIAYIEE